MKRGQIDTEFTKPSYLWLCRSLYNEIEEGNASHKTIQKLFNHQDYINPTYPQKAQNDLPHINSFNFYAYSCFTWPQSSRSSRETILLRAWEKKRVLTLYHTLEQSKWNHRVETMKRKPAGYGRWSYQWGRSRRRARWRWKVSFPTLSHSPLFFLWCSITSPSPICSMMEGNHYGVATVREGKKKIFFFSQNL